MSTRVNSNALSLIPAPSIAVNADGGKLRSFEQIAKLLWRRRMFIAVCGICFGATAFITTDQMPKRYTAEGLVAVDTQRFMVPELQGLVGVDAMTDTAPQVRSEAIMLRSPSLLRSVVDTLNLVDDPEFNSALRQPGLFDKVRSTLIGALRGEYFSASIRDFLIKWKIIQSQIEESTPISSASIRENVFATLSNNLAVFNDGRSLVISVAFTSENPARAAQIINQLFDLYLGTKREVRASRNREGMAALQQRLEEAQQELDNAEERVREFRARHGLISIRAGSVIQQQVEDLTSALARAAEERARIGAIWDRAQAMANRGTISTDTVDVLTSQTITRLREREAEAVRRVADATSRLGPNHPDRRTAEAELSAARAELRLEAQRVVASIGEQTHSARQREAELSRQLERAHVQATQLSAMQAELLQLEKNSDTRRILYQNLLQRVEQSAGEPRDPQVLGVQVVSHAVPPIRASAPRAGLSGGVGLLLGLSVGGFLSLLQGRQRGAFNSQDELEQETRLPVLAAVPRTSGWGAQASLPVRVVAEPNGAEAEALRGLRAQLRFAIPQATPRSVAFTASVPGESSASLAAAFARLAAADGLRVLLIEGNLQRPSLAGALGVVANDGLLAALSHHTPWTDAIVDDTATSLDLLLVSEPPPHAYQLLEGVRFQQLLADACEEYNLVVVNTPAVTQAAETLLLAHWVDAMVLVVEAGSTSRQRVIAAAERLVMASTGFTAAVLNRSLAKI